MIAHIVGGTCEIHTHCDSIFFDICRWLHMPAAFVQCCMLLIRSKLGFKCLFNLTKPIYFFYNKENAIQHHHCTSWSSYSVTMTTNSISSGTSIDVKSRLFYPVCSIRAFLPNRRKFRDKVILFLEQEKAQTQHKATFQGVGCYMVATPLDHFCSANSMALQIEMSTLWL